MRVIRLTIFGEVPSLKNEKKIGRGRMYNAPEVEKYKADFAVQVQPAARNAQLGSKDAHLHVSIWLFHPSWLRDADAEIVYDCLQAAGVISNDRWVRRKHIFADRIDAANPRAEITIEEKGVVT